MRKILKLIAVAKAVALSALPLSVQEKNIANKGYEIYEGEYVSTLLVGDIMHDYIGENKKYYTLASFMSDDNPKQYFYFTINVHESGATEGFFTFEGDAEDMIDWESLNKHTDKYDFDGTYLYIRDKNIPLYFKKPFKATGVQTYTKQYLTTTTPALAFAGGYDGFIPSFYYTSISGNNTFFEKITSLSSLIRGKVWTSGNVASLNIEKDNFIVQNYYVLASVEDAEQLYSVWLCAYAKSKDGQKSIDLNISELGYVDLGENVRRSGSYNFPYPVSTLAVTQGYYDIVRSGGAYGITDSLMTYQEGYKDGQGNPTFKTFIVSAFNACSAFFSIPVLGQNITIGTLIGSFVGLGALFLIIRLFR